jgi:soluble cytochrome b562
VRTREILRRLDAHEERTQTLLARMDERIELTRQQIELSRAESRAAIDDARAAVDEARTSREEVREEMRTSREEMRAFMREIITRFEALARWQVAELRELREESRAQTQALLRVIDRMDRLEPGSGNAG